MNLYFIRAARKCATATLLGFLVFSTGLSARAAGMVSYHVDLVTTALTGGTYSGPYTMDFQFIDGGGSAGEPNNLAVISDFTYGGGTGPTSLIDLNDGLVPGPGEATVAFSAGTKLDFDISVTTNQDTGPGATPDSLSFAILDANDNPIPTTDPGDAFFYITESGNALSPAPLVQTYSASNGRGGTFSPTISAQSASAPDLSSLAYLTAASFGLAVGGVRCLKLRRTGSIRRQSKHN